jgi:ubiquinone/menaquinone biosynthesis C-methylase UbiE
MKLIQKANKIIHFFDKNFKPRWERYSEILLENINIDTFWIDCGCGDNGYVKEYGSLAKRAVGLDLIEPKDNDAPFLQSSIKKIPFDDNEVDLGTLRFVVEHLPEPDNDLYDLQRSLKDGGKVIVLTTNIKNPIIAIARLFPYKIKRQLITKIFKVEDDDVFPTYHQLNTPQAFKKGIGKLKPIYIEYISDINRTNNVFFILYLIWHIITMPKFLNKFRSNILCVFEKK